MASVTVKYPVSDERVLVHLAREVAADINNIETILSTLAITEEQWADIRTHPHFVKVLNESVLEWTAATNTEQRVKLKSAALLEMWLEEANARLYDKSESLAAKTELAKFIGRLAGMGLTGANINAGGGESFSLTINLGADTQLKYEKQLPVKVIEHEPTQKET